MAERIALTAKPRGVIGKRVRHLRREGRLPGNVYGKDVASVAVDMDAHDFARTMKHHGSRGLFDLSIDGESTARPVVIRALSRQGGTGDLIHVDFYQVDPRRPIVTSIFLHLTGDPPAVRDLAGTLVTAIETISVRCLPLDIPEAIQVDLSGLVSFDVSVTVGDLEIPEGVEVLTDPSVMIATVAPPRLRLEGEEEGVAEGEAETEGEGSEGGEAAEAGAEEEAS